jgi:Fe-S-cluster containining protein
LTNLSQWFKLTEEVFIEKYCRKIPYYDGTYVLCLKEKENYDCILWDNGCTAYEARPTQCSTYPFWSRILSSKEMWNEEGLSCPGINNGKAWTKDEILVQLNKYKNNEPLHIKKEEEKK